MIVQDESMAGPTFILVSKRLVFDLSQVVVRDINDLGMMQALERIVIQCPAHIAKTYNRGDDNRIILQKNPFNMSILLIIICRQCTLEDKVWLSWTFLNLHHA